MGVKLRKVSLKDEELFKEQLEKFSGEGFNFAYKYDPDRPFSEYLQFLLDCESGTNLAPEDVQATFLLAENDDGEIVGRISIRHQLNDFLERIGGHVGYGVLVEFRKTGYGTQILKEAKSYIKNELNLNRILVTCDETNIGSIKIIESNGGIYENSYMGPEVEIPKKRYWIEL